MDYKFQFYERYGVEEYYIYDPDELTLEGWQRQGNQLVDIARMSGWVSPRLGIRFDWQSFGCFHISSRYRSRKSDKLGRVAWLLNSSEFP
jgi:hypothetical protein